MNTLAHKQRIDIADALRGVAVLGIILLHAIEHFNFYSFPDTSTQGALLNFTDTAIWDGMFFAFAGKAYAIFALLFGFSFYIQDRNVQQRGGDFRLRFCWRLILLFILGNINAAFFTGEVLVLYSIVGFILPLTARLNDKWMLGIACVLLIQPLHVVYAIISVFNPEFTVPHFETGSFWRAANEMQAGGDFWQMAAVNLKEGQLASLAWAWDNARFFQSAALFIMGVLVGRRGLFLAQNVKFWYRAIAWGAVCFFPLYGLTNMMTPEFITHGPTLACLKLIIKSLSNFSFMIIIVAAIVIGFYNSRRIHSWLLKLVPYGRMSLTNYLTQSIVGAFLFYNWGLGLYDDLGITYSFLLGIALFVVQYMGCRWWMSRYAHGPFEYLWKRATWLK